VEQRDLAVSKATRVAVRPGKWQAFEDGRQLPRRGQVELISR
jgi:hypothetical protein